MAEPVSIASGLVALATLHFDPALPSLIVQSYQNHPKTRTRPRWSEPEALNGVLSALIETLNANTDTNPPASNIPSFVVERPVEVLAELEKSSTRFAPAKGLKTGAQLQYMGEDIDGFPDEC